MSVDRRVCRIRQVRVLDAASRCTQTKSLAFRATARRDGGLVTGVQRGDHQNRTCTFALTGALRLQPDHHLIQIGYSAPPRGLRSTVR